MTGKMKLFTVVLAVLGVALGGAGCANPINAYTGARYFEAAKAAEQAGDLAWARRNYSRAYGNARIGNLGPDAEARTLYEYARICGYLGETAEAEKSFAEVLVLIGKAKGETDTLLAPTRCEQARILHDSGQYAKAALVYTEAVLELEKRKVAESDPIGFALFLDEFAATLRAVALPERAAPIEARSAALRSAHPGRKPLFVNITGDQHAARAAQARNDWARACLHWQRAITHAELLEVSPGSLAALYYEHGRSLGVVADFSAAESYLKKALEIDEANRGEVIMDLSELARLNYDQGKFAEAAAYYGQEMSLPETQKHEKEAPAAFIDLLTEYADCLSKIGQGDAADKARQRAQAIRAGVKELHSISERTPYGKYPRQVEGGGAAGL